MNTRGNFIRMVKTIVLPGVLDDGTESIKLKHENAKPATIIPTIISNKLKLSEITEKIDPSIKGIEEKSIP